MRAGPYQLAVLLLYGYFAVPAAFLAIIALCIKLGVNNIVVNKAHHLQNGLNIVLHVRHLNVAYGPAGGKMLELRLKAQLREGVYLLGNVNVIGIGDVALVRHAGDYAETLL